MKPYIVVKFPSCQPRQLYTNDVLTGRNIMVDRYQQETTTCDQDVEENQDIYFCSTAGDATALCRMLIERYPQHTWMSAKTHEVFSRTPGPVTMAVYTDKGLLPA